ncbi:uncharacterized protein DUF1028 [Silicimonas algicola]|uniref:Uncharacterized protein DUF1028 n=1 Tax=Silicimonas algicola TaxID=1826607 RepID=A0A316FYC4_9RHOB|nr:DUF1028 domain-containing protein [Silicimonas algicola]PWK52706.1 uncharacterized protein DUF1028 [Silicimonas algicola]
MQTSGRRQPPAYRQIAILRADGVSAVVSGEAVLDRQGTHAVESVAATINNLRGPNVLYAIEAACHEFAGGLAG